MHTARIVFTVMMALILMGCPPPVSDNPASGSNDSAQSGDNPEPKAIVVSQVSAGADHSMIVMTDGSLWAAGSNDNGQLGDGSTTDRLTPVKVKTAGGAAMTEVKQVSSGANHSMILKKNGDLWAVGLNKYGQLGDGSTAKKSNPVQVVTAGSAPHETIQSLGVTNPTEVLTAAGRPLTEVAHISSGNEYTMIVKTDDTLWAVGWNVFRQLSDSTHINRSTPVEVKTATGRPMIEVSQVSVGNSHTVILKKNGDLWAVGKNTYGQLGDGSTAKKSNPVQVMIDEGQPMTEVVQVSAGFEHSMLLKKNGDLWAVGDNFSGQLGDGSKVAKKNPVQVMIAEDQPMTEVAQVSAGGAHTMILKENGELWAVGDNQYGQIGDGTTNQKSRPVQVKTATGEPMTEVASVSAGSFHTMIVKRNGTLWAVGWNQCGQLGNGNSGDDAVELIPVEITVQ